MPKRHYDVEMIRDFLENLRWEYAIGHFKNTHSGSTNAELVEQLAKYIKKWNTNGLKRSVQAGDEPEEVIRAYHVAAARRCRAVLDSLDSLKPVFEEAFFCAENPEKSLVVKLCDVPDMGNKEGDV
jgi:hypothetical protein